MKKVINKSSNKKVMECIFQDSCIDFISKHLKQYQDNLDSLYAWKIDNHIVESLSRRPINSDHDNDWAIFKNKKENTFNRTLALRRIFKQINWEELGPDKKNGLIAWIIKDWGKIGSTKINNDVGLNNKLTKIIKDVENTYLDQTQKPEVIRPNGKNIDNISSWSKYLAFRFPEKYAIYDARVIYSLNWLIYECLKNNHVSETKYFPEPSSRNTVLNALDHTIIRLIGTNGFANLKDALLEDIRNRNKPDNSNNTCDDLNEADEPDEAANKSIWLRSIKKDAYVRKDQAYFCYCDLLSSISIHIYGEKDDERLIKVEMMLFALADKDIAERVFDALYISEATSS